VDPSVKFRSKNHVDEVARANSAMCTSNVVIISLLDPIARIHLGKVAAGGDFPFAVFTEREQARHASAKNEMRVLCATLGELYPVPGN